MKSRLRILSILLLLVTISDLTAASATTLDVHEMADVCMYVERILKDYALIGMKVNYHDPEADLKMNAKVVDRYLADIESHHLPKALDTEVREIHSLWARVEPLLLDTPDKEKMLALHGQVDDLAKRCVIVADHLAYNTGIVAEHDVVLIAALGMETQRLGALYMMKAWGVNDGRYTEEVQEILDEFIRIETELMQADEKLVSSEVKAQLKTLDDHFRVLTIMAQAAGNSGRFVPTRFERSTTEVFNELRELLELEEHNVE